MKLLINEINISFVLEEVLNYNEILMRFLFMFYNNRMKLMKLYCVYFNVYMI